MDKIPHPEFQPRKALRPRGKTIYQKRAIVRQGRAKQIHPHTKFWCPDILSPDASVEVPTFAKRIVGIVSFTFPNRNSNISTPRLNGLLHLHLAPINVVISYESQTIPNLEGGFALRCFQSLSIPDIATRQCHWRDSRQTRGQFSSVLSYWNQIFSRINACSR